MTDDLVNDLRAGIYTCDGIRALRNRAADHIEKLEAENEELRSKVGTVRLAAKYAAKIRDDRVEKLEAALRELACKCVSNCDWEKGDICPSWTARKALEGKDE